MELQTIRKYFSFLAKIQYDLQTSRKKLSAINSYSLYKMIATKSQPIIDQEMLISFLKGFSMSLQNISPDQIDQSLSLKITPSEKITKQDLIKKGVYLLFSKWSNQKTLNYQQFTKFIKNNEELPNRGEQVEFSYKKHLFNLIEKQIQNLLDAESFRKSVILKYKNIDDLFQSLSCNGQLTGQQIQNLFLMVGQKKQQQFFINLQNRFPLPRNEVQFKNWFNVNQIKNKYQKQTKIYYSSIKRKHDYHLDSTKKDKFMTPNGKADIDGFSSTKVTKAQRLHDLKLQNIQISKFDNSYERKDTSILASILFQQQHLNEAKRLLMYQPDYDIQLIYQQRGKQFKQILNSRYGSCNFTSFVRYLVPKEFEHKSYAFIKYQNNNILSQQTNTIIDQLIEAQIKKQEKINQIWNQTDRLIAFRSYCRPGHNAINIQQLSKYFTIRQINVIFDRMDPHKTQSISYDYFI